MDIVFLSTFKEVPGIVTNFPIACVTDKQCRIALMGKKECDAMSKHHFIVNVKLTVPIIHYRCFPIPTFIWAAFIDILPKALNLIWGQWSNWFNLICRHVGLLLGRCVLGRMMDCTPSAALSV